MNEVINNPTLSYLVLMGKLSIKKWAWMSEKNITAYTFEFHKEEYTVQLTIIVETIKNQHNILRVEQLTKGDNIIPHVEKFKIASIDHLYNYLLQEII